MIRKSRDQMTKSNTLRAVEQSRRKWNGYATRAYKRALREQYSHLLNAWRQQAVAVGGGAVEVAESIKPNDQPLISSMENVYVAVGSHFAKMTHEGLVGSKKELKAGYFTDYMRSYVQRVAGERVKTISGTTRRNFINYVKTAVDKAISEGLSIDDTAELISKMVKSDIGFRAVRIARTEVIAASNAGSLHGAKSTGLALKKSWLSAKSGKTRRSHQEMDGVMVDLNEEFNVPIYLNDGTKVGFDKMEYPGDPTGSASNTINCRCTITYKRLT